MKRQKTMNVNVMTFCRTAARVRGFTLIELMVTLSVAAILTTIAVPDSSRLPKASAGLPRSPDVNNAAAGTIASPSDYYSIVTAVAATSYTLTATPVGGQTADTTCASIVLSSSGQSATNTGGTDQTKTCWGSR